ncbi:histidine phosphatase, putative [Bodo saltans]|uniref:Histidine phosphatase, putative n=1 Tax=Bodo saltans TaxID=75058 RepID=A0A0S4JKQ8_BODSA|nr:histidine phosphatase, putative [Bodo saltans]|eukprot:CUG89570.1 histidine phosphatase, putative [Bodo saltans]
MYFSSMSSTGSEDSTLQPGDDTTPLLTSQYQQHEGLSSSHHSRGIPHTSPSSESSHRPQYWKASEEGDVYYSTHSSRSVPQHQPQGRTDPRTTEDAITVEAHRSQSNPRHDSNSQSGTLSVTTRRNNSRTTSSSPSEKQHQQQQQHRSTITTAHTNSNRPANATPTTPLLLFSPRHNYVSSGPPLMNQYVVLIRHGERRDSLPNTPSEADPPLTEAGKREVVNAALRIKQQIGVKTSKQLMIMSSPFVRTMETAAELQRYDIGIDRPATIDNTICEVFGPLRVKGCATAPDVVRKDAIGDLPRWGESIQDATDRFVTSFLRNANRHRSEHLILVSHGDAIGGVLNHFYPKRVVYSADFLSFIVLKRTSSTSDRFTLHGSHGVEWVNDGDEGDDDAPTSATQQMQRTSSDVIIVQTAAPKGTKLYEDERRQTAAGQSSSYGAANEASSIGRAGSSTAPRSSSSSAPPRDELSDGQRGTASSSRASSSGSNSNRLQVQIIYILHVLVVLSQMPALRIWPSIRDAVVYIVNVAVLELISLWYGWQSVVDRLPFGFGSPRRRVFIRLARYPVVRTVGKVISLFVLYIVSAIPIGWIAGATAASVMSSIGANLWHLLLLSIYIVLDVWRGSLDNSVQEADEDPHRESI